MLVTSGRNEIIVSKWSSYILINNLVYGRMLILIKRYYCKISIYSPREYAKAIQRCG